MTTDELRLVIDAHALWLAGKPGGARADLYGANIYGADISGANLSRADLSRANLYGANIYGANLSGANLYGADLSGANLYGANIYGADLSGANLYGADLSRANLSRADLSRANLSRADLSGANLSRADLSGADLSRANLSRADLSRANLYGASLKETKNAKLVLARTEIQPREGEVIGWKKCAGNVIVKLRVPPEAKRSNAMGRKCRAEFVEVLKVFSDAPAISLHDGITMYREGDTVRANGWTEDRLVECGCGIHYYLTREEAEAHY